MTLRKPKAEVNASNNADSADSAASNFTGRSAGGSSSSDQKKKVGTTKRLNSAPKATPTTVDSATALPEPEHSMVHQGTLDMADFMVNEPTGAASGPLIFVVSFLALPAQSPPVFTFCPPRCCSRIS